MAATDDEWKELAKEWQRLAQAAMSQRDELARQLEQAREDFKRELKANSNFLESMRSHNVGRFDL